MSTRSLSIRAFAPAVCLVPLLISPLFAQQTPDSQTPPASSTSQQAPATLSTNAAPPATSAEPDYPDPRSITIGLFGLFSPNTSGPDLKGGVEAAAAGTYENLYGMGRAYKIEPREEFSMPVTRTGTLYVEYNRIHGSGFQFLDRQTTINSYTFNPGDDLSSTYTINTSRIYLEDLLFPHKFPVSRFRVMSIWGIRYIGITQTVDSYAEDTFVVQVARGSFNGANYYILYPEFGIAPEYAISKHVVFRLEASGFAFPHRSTMGDGGASLSFRKNNLEVLMGVTALHFKTSPQKEEYMVGSFITPFVGLRWHF